MEFTQELCEELRNKIDKLRFAYGSERLEQKDVAQKIGVSPNDISCILKGESGAKGKNKGNILCRKVERIRGVYARRFLEDRNEVIVSQPQPLLPLPPDQKTILLEDAEKQGSEVSEQVLGWSKLLMDSKRADHESLEKIRQIFFYEIVLSMYEELCPGRNKVLEDEIKSIKESLK